MGSRLEAGEAPRASALDRVKRTGMTLARPVLSLLNDIGATTRLLFDAVFWGIRPPFRLRLFVEATPGLLLEDKLLGIAVHYRAVPELESAVINEIVAASRQLGVARHIQLGDKVAELKAGIRNKGSAVCDFMQEAPFAGRRPVFVGDDFTDLDAFEWVIAHGGFGVAVGERVQSNYALADSRAVGRWIEDLIAVSKPAANTEQRA